MRRFRLVAVLVAALVLLGCAAKPELPDHISPDQLHGSTGLLVGSFSRAEGDPSYHAYNFYFRNIHDGGTWKIRTVPEQVFSFKFHDDFSDAGTSGALFAFLLPARDYEFFDFSLFRNAGYIQNSWSAEGDFSIPFHIAEREILYIGEIMCPVTGKERSWHGGPGRRTL